MDNTERQVSPLLHPLAPSSVDGKYSYYLMPSSMLRLHCCVYPAVFQGLLR